MARWTRNAGHQIKDHQIELNLVHLNNQLKERSEYSTNERKNSYGCDFSMFMKFRLFHAIKLSLTSEHVDILTRHFVQETQYFIMSSCYNINLSSYKWRSKNQEIIAIRLTECGFSKYSRYIPEPKLVNIANELHENLWYHQLLHDAYITQKKKLTKISLSTMILSMHQSAFPFTPKSPI